MNQLHDESDSGSSDDMVQAMGRLFELAAVMGDVMERGLTDRGLTRARAEVVWQVHARGPQTQRALSQALGCTPRNVTGLLDALEADGYVTRGPHPEDRRATVVTLTGQGRSAATGWQSDWRHWARRVFAGVPGDELASFVGVLDEVLPRLRDAGLRDSDAADGNTLVTSSRENRQTGAPK